jgi:hypothetical protein
MHATHLTPADWRADFVVTESLCANNTEAEIHLKTMKCRQTQFHQEH